MTDRWTIDWYVCRADHSDEAFNKEQRKAKRETRVIKAGDELWRAATSIGPITFDHSHWGGNICQMSPAQTEWVAKACAAYEAAGNIFPEDKT